jgi:hypothetical protein
MIDLDMVPIKRASQYRTFRRNSCHNTMKLDANIKIKFAGQYLRGPGSVGSGVGELDGAFVGKLVGDDVEQNCAPSSEVYPAPQGIQ